jgi:hypothetical protein
MEPASLRRSDQNTNTTVNTFYEPQWSPPLLGEVATSAARSPQRP